MSCRSCTSENLKEFGSEINIHFPGRQGLDKAAVLIFPRIIVCVDCRFTEFTFSEAELHLLRERDAAVAALRCAYAVLSRTPQRKPANEDSVRDVDARGGL